MEFQTIVNTVTDIKDKYYSKIQGENSTNLLKQLIEVDNGNSQKIDNILDKIEKIKILVEQTTKLSEVMHKNFESISTLTEKITFMEGISSEKISDLNNLSIALTQAVQSLGNENTLMGLKHLESIVLKK